MHGHTSSGFALPTLSYTSHLELKFKDIQKYDLHHILRLELLKKATILKLVYDCNPHKSQVVMFMEYSIEGAALYLMVCVILSSR